MRPFPMTVLRGGINRLRIKGGAPADSLYDLQNAYITNDGSVVPREGTIRVATLDSSTVGLAAADGHINIFSSAYSTATLPAGYVLNVLSNPNNPSVPPVKIWYAKPFMGFPYVVAEFNDGEIFHYWLQNEGTWAASTDYTSSSIVLPPVLNGLAYQGVRNFPPQPQWAAETTVTSGSYVEPTTPTGFAYQAVATTGTPVHTGAVEPIWPTVAGGILQEFGDFDLSTSDAGTTQASNSLSTATPLGSNITDRYGNSSTIANAGIAPTNSTLTSTLASTKITTWQAGTNYAPGAVVVPTSNQGAFINAIPNGDFEGGSGAGGWTFTDPGGATQWAYSTLLPYQGAECLTFPGGASVGAGGGFATMTSFGLVTPGQSVTATAYLNPNNSGANLTLGIQLNWYDASDSIISSSGHALNEQEGGGYRLTSVTGTAPPGAAHVRVSLFAGSGTNSRNAGFADLVSWNLEHAAPITNFLFEAVQPAAGSSAATEPTWPTVLGNQVIDGGVTWRAIGTSIITWQAIPLMQSGLVAPTFPTTVGNSVHDYSTYSNINGFITTNSSMSWEAIDRHIADPKNPNTVAVAIGASHVFAGDNDIVDYSAAVDPTDWSSTNNAGYLPTGLNNYGDNPVTALALYRGNLVAFNAGGYQMWQIDPDPQNMALLDAQPVGSTWPRAAQSVANDLLFLTEVGVRNLGTIGATANMAIGNTGQQVDPLIKAQLVALANGTASYISTGAVDPFFPDVGLLLQCDGANGTNLFPDSGPNNLTVTATGPVVDTSAPKFGTGAMNLELSNNFNSTNRASVAATTSGPIDLSIGDFTIEFWMKANTTLIKNYGILSDDTVTPSWQVQWSSGGFSGPAGQISFAVRNVVTQYSAVGPTTIADPVVGTWHAVACVKQGGNITVFWDGIAGVTQPVTGGNNLIAGNGNVIFGSVLSGSFCLPGEIDEVRITKGVARYTANYTPATQAFGAAIPYDPFSLYYPGRGQYWLFFGPQAFVLTINGNSVKSWARYLFPDTITDWTLNAGILYLRTQGNLVWQLDASTLSLDDANSTIASASNTPFDGLMQWPYLDMGSLGLNKMMVGVDLVGEGSCNIQIGYNQGDKSTFNDNANFATSTGVTTPYLVSISDTVPGEPLPIPINAPSYSLILKFPGTLNTASAWSFEAANLYVTDAGGGGSTG